LLIKDFWSKDFTKFSAITTLFAANSELFVAYESLILLAQLIFKVASL